MARQHKPGALLGKIERKRRTSIKTRKTGGKKSHYGVRRT